MPTAWIHPHIPRIEAGAKRVVSTKFRDQKIAYFGTVLLNDADFRVHQKGRERTLATGQRNVHAWAIGDCVEALGSVRQPPVDTPGLSIVTYNPFKGDHFYDVHTGEKVEHAKFLWAAGKTFWYIKE